MLLILSHTGLQGVNESPSIYPLAQPGDPAALPSSMTPPYIHPMKLNLRRGDRVKIKGGRYDGAVGTVDSVVFQRTDDQPNEFQHGYHVILDAGRVVTVNKGQVA